MFHRQAEHVLLKEIKTYFGNVLHNTTGLVLSCDFTDQSWQRIYILYNASYVKICIHD